MVCVYRVTMSADPYQFSQPKSKYQTLSTEVLSMIPYFWNIGTCHMFTVVAFKVSDKIFWMVGREAKSGKE